MKRKLWIIMLACVCLLGYACQNNRKKNTPEAATEAFVKAFYKADFTHMYQFATKKSQIVIKTLQDGMKSQPERVEAMRNSVVEVESVEVKNLNDTMATSTTTVLVDGTSLKAKWDLAKENGEWKVTMVMP